MGNFLNTAEAARFRINLRLLYKDIEVQKSGDEDAAYEVIQRLTERLGTMHIEFSSEKFLSKTT
jgi:hypothetical protein